MMQEMYLLTIEGESNLGKDDIHLIQYRDDINDPNTVGLHNWAESISDFNKTNDVEFVAVSDYESLASMDTKDITDDSDVLIKVLDNEGLPLEFQSQPVQGWLRKRDALTDPYRLKVIEELKKGNRVKGQITELSPGELRRAETRTSPYAVTGFTGNVMISKGDGYIGSDKYSAPGK